MNERPVLSFTQQSEWIFDEVKNKPGIPPEEIQALAALIIRTPNPEDRRFRVFDMFRFTLVEMAIVQAFINGQCRDKQISGQLEITTNSVRNHIEVIRGKIVDIDPSAQINTRTGLQIYLHRIYIAHNINHLMCVLSES